MPAASEVFVEQESRLAARAEDVWRRAVTPEGINHELGPWLRMTMPTALRGRTIDDVPLGRRLGRSWLLLFGLIPVDYDDLTLAERGPGMRFVGALGAGHRRLALPAPPPAACDLFGS